MSDSSSESGSAAGGAAAAAGPAATLADWQGWSDDPEEDDTTRSLFSDVLLPSPEACFEHDALQHGFDIRAFRAQVKTRSPLEARALCAQRTVCGSGARATHLLQCLVCDKSAGPTNTATKLAWVQASHPHITHAAAHAWPASWDWTTTAPSA